MQQILETTNYAMFSFLQENRQPHNRPMLAESIKKHGLLMPIDVNANLQIIDGQHRFLACMQLGLPVQYRVVNYDAALLFEVNNLQEKWATLDWLNAAKVKGHQSTIEFYQACGRLLTADEAAIICECYATGTGNMVRSVKAFLGIRSAERGTNYRVDERIGNWLYTTYKMVLKYSGTRLSTAQIGVLKGFLLDNANTINNERLREIVITGDVYPTTDRAFYKKQIQALYNKGLRINKI